MSPLAPSSSGSGTLADFQREFARALLDPGAGRGGIGLTPGFAVHRNTVLSGCIDALAANYPVVAALVGREWFRDAAAAYARETPPVDARLMHYGADFHAFLGRLPVVEALPCLPGVALLERLWRESHMAADAPALQASHLRDVPAESLARLCPRPHPAARWRWFGEGPVLGVWQAHQVDDEARCRAALEAVAWRAEGALLTRIDGKVEVRRTSRAACALLDACAGGAPLGVAIALALDASAEDDGVRADAVTAAGLLRELVDAGALRGLDPEGDG